MTIIGDSIIKYIRMQHVRTQARSGATLRLLEQDILSRQVDLAGFGTIVVHVGTNDVANGGTETGMLERYKDLARAIKLYSDTESELIFSAIIPSWYRDGRSDGVVHRVNKRLITWHNQQGGVCSRTFSIFRREHKILPDMYAMDRLHLSRKGVAALTEYFKSHTTPGYLKTLRMVVAGRQGQQRWK